MALTNKLQAIGDAIRAKTGKTDALTLDEMVTEIGNIDGGGTGFLTIDDEWNLTGTITEIPDNLFYSGSASYVTKLNTYLKTVNLEKAETVGSYSFAYCYMTSASFPICTTVNDHAFYVCKYLTSIDLPNCTIANTYAFYNCANLVDVNLPNCLNVNANAFQLCQALENISLPACTAIGGSAFSNCGNLVSVNLPVCSTIVANAFSSCKLLEKVDLGACHQIQNNVFSSCYSLKSLILRYEDKIVTPYTNMFSSCYHILGTVNATYNPDGLKDGYIYVPDALVDTYKANTIWATYESQIKPLSELPSE